MSHFISLDDLRAAWKIHDPEFVNKFLSLLNQPKPPGPPIPVGAYTFEKFIEEIQSERHDRKSESQRSYRVSMMAKLEAPNADVPLEPKYKSYEILLALWQSEEPFARRSLIEILQVVPLIYGPWRGIKRIFKEAEAKQDSEIYGLIAARLDTAQEGEITRGTLIYLVRRARRFLRRISSWLPTTYADVACDFLIHFPNTKGNYWLVDYILENHDKLWQRTPRPLFRLLEQAQSDVVFKFAIKNLKSHFPTQLREVEPAWVARLTNRFSKEIHSFVIWILNNVPKFEQSRFRELGLHEAVLSLFDSPADEARTYAAKYARSHARDLTTEQLIRLVDNSNNEVVKLALDFIKERHPRKDIGLDAWGRLLETKGGHKLAADTLKKHFGPKELTPDWFVNILFSPSEQSFNFALNLFPQVHDPSELGAIFFYNLINRITDRNTNVARRLTQFALNELDDLDVNSLQVDALKRLLVNPLTSKTMLKWIDSGKLPISRLGIEFFRTMAYQLDWAKDPFIVELLKDDAWKKDITFNEDHAVQFRKWLADPRKFSPSEVGLEWLLEVVQNGDSSSRSWASEFLNKAFLPADFAPQSLATSATSPATKAPVDLKNASFLFTGKLATMNRKEAEEKVKSAGGVLAGSVSKNLAYLVVGDEGSPLYGQGKKGEKQTKAEDLIAKGANISIISETTFLKMLAGTENTSVSTDSVMAGCERLWGMAIAAGTTDAPLGVFARNYILNHHKEIAAENYERLLDTGSEIPQTFFSFERFKPLLLENRTPLREFALEVAKFEFARWHPPAHELVVLCELPFAEVRRFVAQALLEEPHPKNVRYRLDPERLSPSGVYRFCESPNDATRAIGLQLIERSQSLKVPEELFRLTESSDRRVRSFVVRCLWNLYRDRGVTPEWKPALPRSTRVSQAARKKAEQAVANRGPGVPSRAENPPADESQMTSFLRRILFELPPPRTGITSEADREVFRKLKTLPARKAKLSLVEIMRDLALQDPQFAEAVYPLLLEFMGSFGRAERDACLVAVTRLKLKYPQKFASKN
ncbi:MAG: BRCT domain-containing protein [Gemmataceae bacterium]|jgi:hypothetical protein|nr:BRCT domain-containing protein [Gemmataceae bacterium]